MGQKGAPFAPPGRSPAAWIAAAAGTTVAAIVTALLLSREPKLPAAPPAPPPAPTLAMSPAATGQTPNSARATDPNRVPLVAPDLEHVDLKEIIRQAQVIALQTDSQLKLVRADSWAYRDGLVDATQSYLQGRGPAARVDFQFVETDPSQPPGNDRTGVRVVLDLVEGVFLVSVSSFQSSVDGIDTPLCSSASAWGVALKSHMPANAVAKIHLTRYDSSTRSNRSAWIINVDGHNELERIIDAKSCRLIRSG
jgi:hypothetical protein